MQKYDHNPFSLQSHLDWLYGQKCLKYALRATSLQEFQIWRDSFKSELRILLGIDKRESRSFTVEFIKAVDHELYEEQDFKIDIEEEVAIPVFVLVPKSNPPYHPILVFHGHDPSAQYCMGNYPDSLVRKKNLTQDNNYAQALAEAGFLVCVVEQRGLGNRITDQVSADSGFSCRHLAFSYLLHGRTLLGERILDGMNALSYLLSRPDVTGKPGCTGQSGGGTTALWLSALDERIQAVVISGYFNTFKGSILAMEHCECNYVPGILNLSEMGDLAALIAPRPFCAINGEQDAIFPIENARSEFLTLQRAYALTEQPNSVQLFIHPGGHTYDHKAAYNWFRCWLK